MFDLKRFGKRHFSYWPNARRFAVASVGFSASKWLATILHETEGIACSHGANGREYDFGLGDPSSPILNTPVHVNYQIDRKASMSIFEMLDELGEYFPDAKVLGNVHAFTATEIGSTLIDPRWFRNESIESFNLVRHPYGYAASLFFAERKENVSEHEKAVRSIRSLEPHIAYWQKDSIIGRAPSEPVGGDIFERLKWMAGVRSLCWTRNVLAEIRDTRSFSRLVPMERMTGEPGYFAGAIGDLIGPERVTDDLLHRAFSGGKINSKRLSPEERRIPDNYMYPMEVLEGYPAWAREILFALLDDYGAKELYEGTGYEFYAG